ncbi:hypothetical protein MMC22_003596 [Lobaria immixta]|nr:hypothetical protein [Lobaria immixta]
MSNITKLVRRAASPRPDGLPSARKLLDGPNSSDFEYLHELTSPSNPEVDLVAVHGLNFANAAAFGVKTWTAGDRGEEKLWLKDFLPHRLPNVRVLLYGYNSNVAFNTSMMGMGDIAEDLLHKLWTKRQAVVKAKTIPRYLAISRSAKSFAFFATPHKGGFGAGFGHAAAGLVRRLGMNPRTGIMEALRKDSHVAPDIHNEFVDTQDSYHICSFYECKPLHPLGALIVERSSAVMGLGLSEVRVPCPNADHSSICKFAAEDEHYKFVIDEIDALVDWAVKSARKVSVSPRRSSSASSSSKEDYSGYESGSSLEIQNPVGSSLTVDSELSLVNAVMDPPEVNRQARRGPFFLVPYSRNSQFVGQQDILHQLYHFSNPSNPMIRFALCGFGGIGKTQIALSHAHWHRLNHPEQSVFWILASDTDHLRDSLALIAAHCKISRTEDTTDIMLDRVWRWLSDEDNGRWLMIIDGADNLGTFFISSGDKQPGEVRAAESILSTGLGRYVPTCLHGKVLITTNNKSAAESLADPGHVSEVHPMNKQYACALLRKYLTEGESTSTSIKIHPESWRNDDLDKLASQLDYLPLALVQAAAYIRMNSLSVTGFLELIASDQSDLPGILELDLQGHGGFDDLSQAFMSTWKVAFNQIEAQCSPASNLLSVMAFYEAKRIPNYLISHFHTDISQSSSRALDTLLAYSFITKDSENETISMHRLAQLAMRKRLSASNSEQKWADEALSLISQNFPGGEYESWTMCAALMPHALKVLRSELYGPAEARPLGTLQSKISRYYLRRGFYQQAEIWSRNALDNMILVAGVEQKDVFSIKSDRVIVLMRLGAFEEAEDLAQEVWRGRRSMLGAKHEDTLQILETLGLVYQAQGRYAEGETAVRKILKSLDRSLEADDIQILAAKQRLGSILRHLGRYREAEEYQRAAFHGCEKILGPRHPDTLKAHWSLGQTLHAWGMYAEAEKIDMDTWTLQKRDDVLGPDHPETLKSLWGFANNLQAQFKFSAAEAHRRELYRRAILLVGSTHIYTLIAGSSLASCLVASNMYAYQPSSERLAEAEDLYRVTLTARKASLRVDHPDTLAARTDLATVQRLRGHVPASELEASERETLDKLKKIFGKEHPLTVKSRDNLSRILWLQRGDSSKSKEALKKAMQIYKVWEKGLGWSHERTWLAAELLVEMLPEPDPERLDLRQKIQYWRRNKPPVD